MLYPLLLLFF